LICSSSRYSASRLGKTCNHFKLDSGLGLESSKNSVFQPEMQST